MTRRAPFDLADATVPPGRRKKIEVPIARLMSGTPVALPVIVVHGSKEGPTAWVNGAIHGDELCGVEIIRNVLETITPSALSGTLIAVPVVNVHGFNTGDRYLPDRRDLNRSFPGSKRGSLGSQIAHLMMTEIVGRCSVGIDVHTGSDHRVNLPHIRANLDDPRTLELAEIFGAPVTVHARLRDGSLRQAAGDAGATVLVFEGGEANRFDSSTIDVGVAGVRRVLASMGMVDGDDAPSAPTSYSRSTTWMRSTRSGVVHLEVSLGDRVAKGDIIATVYDPYGTRLSRVKSRRDGIVIGHSQHPLVNRGDAIAHIATIE